MNRTKYIQIRRIKYNLYYTIRGIVLLPIRLLLLPFKLLRRAVFFGKPKPNKTVLTIIFNKLRGINERITSLNDIHSHRIDKLKKRIDNVFGTLNTLHDSSINVDIKALKNRNEVLSSRINKQLELINDNNSDIKFDFNKKIKALKDKLDYLTKWDTETRGKVKTLEDSIEGVSKDCRAVEMSVNNIKYDIKCKESGIIKDLVFNMPDEPTQVELAQIDAELAGEKVVREEYDWTHEQKAQNELIQAKMRADEAEYDRLSEPDEDDNLLW